MKSQGNRLWRKIGLDKNYLQGASCSHQSPVNEDHQCYHKKLKKQFNSTQHLLGERKIECELTHPGIQKSISQRLLMESSPSKDDNGQFSFIQRDKSKTVTEFKVDQFCEDTLGQGEEDDNEFNQRGRGEGNQSVGGEGGQRRGLQRGLSGRQQCDKFENDRFLIASSITQNKSQPSLFNKPSRCFSKRPTPSSTKIKLHPKPPKKSSFYSQYITLVHNQNNQLQQEQHLEGSENDIQQGQIELIQCEQMVTIQAQQYDVLKRSDCIMLRMRQSILPLINKNMRQLKTCFTAQKSHISQQLSQFRQSIFTALQKMIIQKMQQYIDEIGYLYGENSTLLSKIHAIERQEKEYYERLSKLSNQQTDLSKICERVEELSQVETINQQLGKRLQEAQITINQLQDEISQKTQHIDKLTTQLAQTKDKLTTIQSQLTKQQQAQQLKLQNDLNFKLNLKTNQLLSIIETNTQQYQHLIEKICKLLLPNDLNKIINSTDCTQLYHSHASLLDTLLRVKALKIKQVEHHYLIRNKSYSSARNQINQNNDGMEQLNITPQKNVIKKNPYFGRSSNNSLHYSPFSLLQPLPKKHTTTSRTQPTQQFSPSHLKLINFPPTQPNRRIKTQKSPQFQQSTSPEQSWMKGSCSAYIRKPQVEEEMLDYYIKSYDNQKDCIKEKVSELLHNRSSNVVNSRDTPPNSPINSMKNLLQSQKKSSLYYGCDQKLKSLFQQHKINVIEPKSANATQQNRKHQQLSFNSQLFRKKQQIHSNKTFLLTTQRSKQNSTSPIFQNQSISTKNVTYVPLNKIQSNYMNGPLSQRHPINNNHYLIAQHDGSYSKRDNKNNNATSFHITPEKLSNSPSIIQNQNNKTTFNIQHSPYSKTNKLITHNQNQNKILYFKKY